MQKPRGHERGSAFKSSFLPLLTPIILLGGIVLGVFTPTEAAAVAAGYALIITLFVTHTLKFKKLPSILVNAAVAIWDHFITGRLCGHFCLDHYGIGYGRYARLRNIGCHRRCVVGCC